LKIQNSKLKRLKAAVALFAVLVCFALSGCNDRCECECRHPECPPPAPPKPQVTLNGTTIERSVADQKKAAAEHHMAEQKKVAVSIAFHVKQLKTAKNEDDRATSAEYLGVLEAYAAITDLIDCLRPARQEKDSVMQAANSSLLKLTDKNFGVKGFEDWNKWWLGAKEQFLERKKHEVSAFEKIAAESENTHGLELMNLGEFASALGHFNMATERNPKVADYHNNAGLAYLQVNRPLEAIECFMGAIALNDKAPQPYLNIAMCYEKMNRANDAKLWREKGEKLNNARKVLINSATDPDEEDKLAREHFADSVKAEK
jgi:tetratricopeptide (TPR) repeat protein